MVLLARARLKGNASDLHEESRFLQQLWCLLVPRVPLWAMWLEVWLALVHPEDNASDLRGESRSPQQLRCPLAHLVFLSKM